VERGRSEKGAQNVVHREKEVWSHGLLRKKRMSKNKLGGPGRVRPTSDKGKQNKKFKPARVRIRTDLGTKKNTKNPQRKTPKKQKKRNLKPKREGRQ